LTRVSNEKLVRFGDVLVNSTGIGTLGRVAQIYYDIPNCSVDSHVTIVRPRDRAMIDYFGFYLQSLQPHFDSLGVGSTGQTELSRESIASSNFLLPSKNIQEAFAIFVSPMQRNVMQMLIKNNNLRQTRDLLLPKLISGEVDVEGLDIHIEGEIPDRGVFEAVRGK
jgi:type I restriction enzyme S subunit